MQNNFNKSGSNIIDNSINCVNDNVADPPAPVGIASENNEVKNESSPSCEESIELMDLPDEIMVNILRSIEAPKELLRQRGVSKLLEKRLFDRQVWEKFMPPALRGNQYSATVYQFFARAFYSRAYRNIIQQKMENPENFHQALLRWSEPGEKGFPEIDSVDVLPLLLGVKTVQVLFKSYCEKQWQNNINWNLPDNVWIAVLACDNQELLQELVEQEWKYRKISERGNYRTKPYQQIDLDSKIFWLAAHAGNLNQMIAMWKKSPPAQQQALLKAEGYAAFQKAVEGEDLDILKWIWKQAVPEQQQAMLKRYLGTINNVFRAATEYGNLNILKWLWEQLTEKQQNKKLEKQKNNLFSWAALHGHLHIMKWLWEQATEDQRLVMSASNEYSAFRTAVNNGYSAMLKWLWKHATSEQRAAMLKSKGYEIFPNAVTVKEGRFQKLQWIWAQLTEEQKPEALERILGKVFYVAYQEGHLQILEWLWEQSTDPQRAVIMSTQLLDHFFCSAVQNGHLKTVEWFWKQATEKQRLLILVERNYFYCKAFSSAAKKNYVSVCAFLWEISNLKTKLTLIEKCSDFISFYLPNWLESDVQRLKKVALTGSEYEQWMAKRQAKTQSEEINAYLKISAELIEARENYGRHFKLVELSSEESIFIEKDADMQIFVILMKNLQEQFGDIAQLSAKISSPPNTVFFISKSEEESESDLDVVEESSTASYRKSNNSSGAQ